MSGSGREFPTSYCFPVDIELHEGDRVALLVPPSPSYLDVVIGLLAAGVVPIPLDPRLTGYERDRILGGLSPRWRSPRRRRSRSCAVSYPDTRGLPRARPMHCTSGTTGTPKGVWSGLLSSEEAAALVAEERDALGLRRLRREPRALARSTTPRPLRFAMGTALAGGRVVLPGPFDAGGGDRGHRASSGRPRCSACRPTCSGCSRTGTRSVRRTSRRSAWSPTPARPARRR